MKTSAIGNATLELLEKKLASQITQSLKSFLTILNLLITYPQAKQKNISELKVKEPSSKIISSTKQIFLPIKYITHKL